MLGSIPHQKFCFYHLPTRGWAGIKLGDAWYVSNISIIFDCSMLLYYHLWMFMGFTLHIYIIFGTNLLTGGPARIAVFFAYFSISKKRNIKRSPNGMKPSGAWFLERMWSGELGVQVKKFPWAPRDRGPPPCRACPLSCGPLGRPPTYFFLLYIPTYPENIRSTTKQNFHRRNLLYPWDPILEPSPVLHRRGIDHGGLLHQHHSPSDELWVVYHRPTRP